MKFRQSIKLHQIWKSKYSDQRLEVTGKVGGKWRTRILTDDPKLFGGTHTMVDQTLNRNYFLLNKDGEKFTG